MHDEILEFRRYFYSIQEVKVSPPEWVIPGLVVPGLNLVVGDPKTFKSRLILEMIASVTELKPVAGFRKKVPKKRGSAAYFAAEQSAGRIRFIYEKRVLKRQLAMTGKTSLNFLIAKNAWEWQVDEPAADRNLAEFMRAVKPTITVLDPWVYFHSLDENDPKMVKPIVPLREAALSYGGALLLVHHAKKQQTNGQMSTQGGVDFSRARGTSALWAAADGGIMTTKIKTGAVNVALEFKDHPPGQFTWRPS